MALIVWWLMLWTASAHDVRPGVIALQEVSEDTYTVRVTPGSDGGGVASVLLPRWPAGCVAAADTLRCEDGLIGALAVPPAAIEETQVVVQVQHLDGTVERAVLRAPHDSVQLGAPSNDGAGMSVWLGARHALGGWDHLLFLWGLVLVTGSWRERVVAATGFTCGHGVALAWCAGGLWLPRSPVLELLIALSILCVALEAASASKRGFAGRVGWVSAGFGLVHGLGFAVSMLDGGAASPWTLLWFNVGVEIGQLSALCALFVLAPWFRGVRATGVLLLGGFAAYLSMSRGLLWSLTLW